MVTTAMNRPHHTHSRRPTLLLRAALVAAVALLALAATRARAHTISADTLAFLKEFPKEFPSLRASWAGDNYCAGWEGVTCADDGDVTVSLAGRDLVGEVPALPQNVTGSNVRAVHIDLSGNRNIHGSLPESWAHLSQLRHVDISHTTLYGVLPEEWTSMAALETLKIHNTFVRGRLPTWNIPSLRVIDLSSNRLYGPLVDSWGNMVGLQSVDLSGNRFCGCMPASWNQVTVLSSAAPDTSKAKDCDSNVSCAERFIAVCPPRPRDTQS